MQSISKIGQIQNIQWEIDLAIDDIRMLLRDIREYCILIEFIKSNFRIGIHMNLLRLA